MPAVREKDWKKKAIIALFVIFARGEFEFFHTREVPGYDIRVHRALRRARYIVISRISSKARVWKLSAKALKMVKVMT